MSFAIGFGCTETAFEEAEERAFLERASELFRSSGESFVSDAFVKEVDGWLKGRANLSKMEAGAHDRSDNPPERYTSFRVHLTSSASSIVAIYSFMHINRRHAFSPDGWAALCTERLVHFDAMNAQIKRAAT